MSLPWLEVSIIHHQVVCVLKIIIIISTYPSTEKGWKVNGVAVNVKSWMDAAECQLQGRW